MPSRLYVGNLAYTVSSSDLEQLFSRAGQVQSAAVIMDKVPANRRASASSRWQVRRMVQRQYSNSTIRSSRAEISRSTRPGPANRASAAITEVAAAVVAAATAGRSLGRAWARSFRFHGVRAVAVSTDCSADEMVDAFQGFKPPPLRPTSPAHRRFSGAMRKTRARAGLFVRRPAPEITRLGRLQG
jgi:RNA recognition motif-containing protein